MPTFDAVSEFPIGGTFATFNWSHTIGGGSNRMLAVIVYGEDSNEADTVVTDVTYAGISGNPGPSIWSPGGTGMRATIWYFLEADLPAAGAHTIVVTTNANVTANAAHGISVSDAEQAAPEASATKIDATATSISTSITTLTDNAMLIDGAGQTFGGGPGPSPSGTDHLEREEIIGGQFDCACGTTVVPAAGTISIGWTGLGNGSGRLAHAIIAVAPVDTPMPIVASAVTRSPRYGLTRLARR